MSNTRNRLVLIIVAIAAMAGGLWLAQLNPPPEENTPRIQGAIYPTAKHIESFSLLDQDNQSFTEKSLQGQWSLLFIGYTLCPDICPTTLSLMSEVHWELKDQNLQPPAIIFLSIDPARDTVDVIKKYVEYFNTDFIGLTGDPAQIEKLTRNLNAVYRKAPGLAGEITEDDYLMDHSSALMLINPDGNLQSILTAPHSIRGVIDSLLKSQSYYESL
jgi:protein SCO1/2